MTETRAMTETRWMEVRRHSVAPAAVALLAFMAGCGTPDVIEGGAHEPVTKIDVVDVRREPVQIQSADPFVVGPMKTPDVPGRIIYEPPASLANVADADTLVRRANTATTDPEPRSGAARDSAAARSGSAPARGGQPSGQSGAARDTSGRP